MKTFRDYADEFMAECKPEDYLMISDILSWSEEKKIGFVVAKRIYQDELEKDNRRKAKGRDDYYEINKEQRRLRRIRARNLGESG